MDTKACASVVPPRLWSFNFNARVWISYECTSCQLNITSHHNLVGATANPLNSDNWKCSTDQRCICNEMKLLLKKSTLQELLTSRLALSWLKFKLNTSASNPLHKNSRQDLLPLKSKPHNRTNTLLHTVVIAVIWISLMKT